MGTSIGRPGVEEGLVILEYGKLKDQWMDTDSNTNSKSHFLAVKEPRHLQKGLDTLAEWTETTSKGTFGTTGIVLEVP